ncbi:MAG: cytochrome P450 [Solirubrobacteraceae bacterium]
MRDTRLPPGPRLPAALQSVGFWSRPTTSLERLRSRYGSRFTTRLIGQPPFVVLSDPEDAKAVLTAPPDVLHPGEGARLLEPIVGRHSLILLDEGPHLEQRRLLLPAFHGERIARLTELMEALTARELDAWPLREPFELHPRLQALTLEIILRAVFGLDEGPRLDRLRKQLPELMEFADNPSSMIPFLQHERVPRFRRFAAVRADVDRELYELMEDERRAGRTDGDDILHTLLAATHTDGSPMSNEEIRDELLTALVAGHETTASSLAFAFAEIARAPHVAERLADGEDAEYLEATINETLRRRPVLPNPEPRLVMQPFSTGGWTYPPGVILIVSAQLIHHDPSIYPEPYAFRPERFAHSKPGTYTWLPFGGGRRRCIGVAFALLEMRVVLRQALARFVIAPAAPGVGRDPIVRRRMITITPGDGARVVLSDRQTNPSSETALRSPRSSSTVASILN